MNWDAVVLSVIGIVTLATNITTMFLSLPRKYSLRFSIGIFAAAVAVFLVLINFSAIGAYPLALKLAGLIFLPIVILLFRGQLFQKIFAFFLQFQFVALCVAASDLLADCIVPREHEYAPFVRLIISLVLLAGYLALVLKFGRRVFQRLFVDRRRREWALYAFGAVFSFAFLTAIRSAVVGDSVLILSMAFILWSFVILCFAIINTHEKSKQKYDADFAASILSAGSGHYAKMNEMYDTLATLRHDYKFHLRSISELANAGDIDGIQAYLAQAQAHLPENDLRHYCQNAVLNALLGSYAERCEKENIRYEVMLSMPEEVPVPNYDLCIIIGNLLENAVEACVKREQGRTVELQVKTQGTHLAFMVKNSYDGVVKEENGQPASTKKDGGFGLRSVRAVSDRYGGYMLTEWDEGTFTVYVMLNV